MRYFTVAVVALLVSLPAIAVAGPDALSIAKRALRLAKEPTKVKQLHTNVSKERRGSGKFRVLCPKGWVAVGVSAELPIQFSTLEGRLAEVVLPPEDDPGFGPGPSGITLTCIKGVPVPQTAREPEQAP